MKFIDRASSLIINSISRLERHFIRIFIFCLSKDKKKKKIPGANKHSYNEVIRNKAEEYFVYMNKQKTK